MLLDRFAAAMLFAVFHAAAFAAPEAKTQAEIAHLLDHVATPGCQFNRNGSWHEGSEAKSHLQKKLDYLVKRKLVTNAESFIAGAATESSMSGKPYLVRCGGGQAVASAVYMKEELARFRARASK